MSAGYTPARQSGSGGHHLNTRLDNPASQLQLASGFDSDDIGNSQKLWRYC